MSNDRAGYPLWLRIAVVDAAVALAPLATGRLPAALVPFWLKALGYWADKHTALYCFLVAVVIALTLLAMRAWIHLWYNVARPRIAGTHTEVVGYKAPVHPVALFRELGRIAPKSGEYFVGCSTTEKDKAGNWKPICIGERQRSTHIECRGKTGSGKTASVLFPLAFQDMRAGKGVIIIDFKGSEDNINAVRNLAALANRSADLRIFALPYPKISHTYSPLWMPPTDTEADPLAVAERVFAVFKAQMSEEYYKALGEAFFRSLVATLHGIKTPAGLSLPFTFIDALECMQRPELLLHSIERSTDRFQADNLGAVVKSLGDKLSHSLMGLTLQTQNYTSTPLLNHYDPDIKIEEVFEKNQIVYFQLPTNLYASLGPAIGRMLMRQIQQAGARRQIDRSLNQKPMCVYVDEFYNLANEDFITALNALRDAHVQLFIAYQSQSDLDRISTPFSDGVRDNTLTKIFLSQDNPEVCETIAKSFGTRPALKRTSRKSVGPLALQVDMGEQSEREVDEFLLHPNYLKNLAPCGQAYLLNAGKFHSLNLGQVPEALFRKPSSVPLVAKNPDVGGLRLRELVVGNENPKAPDAFK